MKFRLWFPPPTPPWSTNEDRNLNPYDRASRIKAWKEATVLAWNAARGGNETIGNEGMWRTDAPVPFTYTANIPFRTNQRKDPINFCGTCLKAIGDGLVLAGVVPDDTPVWVTHTEATLRKDPDGIVLVTMEPM